jgi:PST family polysaccharide transporter
VPPENQKARGDVRSAAVRGFRWTSFQEWVQQGVSLVVLLMLARLLTPSDFGTVAIAGAISTILSALQNQGFSSALVQRDQYEPLHTDSAYWGTLAVSALLALLLFISAPAIANFYNEPVLAAMLPVYSVILVIQALGSVHGAILQRGLRFKRLALISIVSSLGAGTVAISLAFNGYGLWSMVFQSAMGTLASTILKWLLSTWRPHARFSFAHLRQLWSFGIHVLGSNLVLQVGRRIDALLLGYFLGTTEVGLYSVGRRVIEMLNSVLMKALGSVTFPTFSRMQRDPPRLARAVESTIRMLSFVAFPTLLLVAALAPYVVRTFLGEKWVDGAPVLSLLALGAAIGSPQWIQMSAVLARGRSDWRLAFNMAALFLGVVAVIVGYPYGIVAVAALLVVRQVVLLPIAAHLLGRLIPLGLVATVRAVAGPLVAAAVAAAAAALVSAMIPGDSETAIGDASALAAGGLFGVFVYLIAARFLARSQMQQAAGLMRELLGRGSPS